MGICSIKICFPAFDGQMRAFVSASLSGDLLDHSWWQATTGARPLGRASRFRGQPHHVPPPGLHYDRPLRLASGTLSQPIMAEYDARTDEALARLVSTLPNSWWVSSMKLWPSGSSSGTTFSLGPRTLCRICNLHLSGTLTASLFIPWPAQTLEDPGSHPRLRGHGRLPGAALVARERGSWGRDCWNLATQRSVSHGCDD